MCVCIYNSVGKTALLRQVLTDPRFHVVHFDLRIAGFADVTSLYMSLAAQFEHFFESLAGQLEGYEEMKKHGLMFKHAWMDWEKRLSKPENQLKVCTYYMLQSSLALLPNSVFGGWVDGRFRLLMWLG